MRLLLLLRTGHRQASSSRFCLHVLLFFECRHLHLLAGYLRRARECGLATGSRPMPRVRPEAPSDARVWWYIVLIVVHAYQYIRAIRMYLGRQR